MELHFGVRHFHQQLSDPRISTPRNSELRWYEKAGGTVPLTYRLECSNSPVFQPVVRFSSQFDVLIFVNSGARKQSAHE